MTIDSELLFRVTAQHLNKRPHSWLRRRHVWHLGRLPKSGLMVYRCVRPGCRYWKAPW